MRAVGIETHGTGGLSYELPAVTRDQAGPQIVESGDRYVGPRSRPAEQPAAKPESTHSALTLPGDRAVLLYNSECSVCRKLSSWVIANDATSAGGGDRIDERPIGHDPEALRAIHPDLDIWQAYETIHLVMPDGTIKKGGEAVAEVLRRLPDTKWITGLLDVSIAGWRPFQALLDAGYTVLDKIRPALGCESCGTPAPWWAKPIEWAVKAWRMLARR